MAKFDYKKAEADLYDSGARHPDEIYEYKSEKAIRGYMKENGLNPDKYYKPDGKSKRPGSGSHSNSGSEGCYLTSACVAAKGLPDNCEQLQTLRAFRDRYLASQPGGREEIDRYYALAPGIVDSINQRADAASVWNRIYGEMIAPCVEMIRAGQNEQAHQLYKAYSLRLEILYCFAKEEIVT